METSKQPRKAVEVPVRIFGTDREGKPFFENLTTVDVSLDGAKLRELKAKLEAEEIVGLTYGKNKGHFRVKWVGTPGTSSEGVLGLVNLNPAKPLWDFPLSQLEPATSAVEPTSDRRRWPRLKCSISVELHTTREAVIWGKASDLSEGGCFIEMALPLPNGTSFDIALWMGEAKLHMQGQVVSVQPGFGNGVRFLSLSSEHQELLRRFVESLATPEGAGMAFAKRPGL